MWTRTIPTWNALSPLGLETIPWSGNGLFQSLFHSRTVAVVNLFPQLIHITIAAVRTKSEPANHNQTNVALALAQVWTVALYNCFKCEQDPLGTAQLSKKIN
jgi:hypothetical protein